MANEEVEIVKMDATANDVPPAYDVKVKQQMEIVKNNINPVSIYEGIPHIILASKELQDTKVLQWRPWNWWLHQIYCQGSYRWTEGLGQKGKGEENRIVTDPEHKQQDEILTDSLSENYVKTKIAFVVWMVILQ